MNRKIKLLLIFYLVLVFMIGVFCVIYIGTGHAFDLEYRINNSSVVGPNTAGQTYKQYLEHELRLSHKNLFLWGSIEQYEIYGNQNDLPAFGAGVKYDYKPFSFWIKAGYYMPEHDQMINWEPGWIFQSDYYSSNPNIPPTVWDNYAVTQNAAFGGEFGVDLKKELFKNLEVGFSVSYRVLTITEYMSGWPADGVRGASGYENQFNRDLSCPRIGFMITYHF